MPMDRLPFQFTSVCGDQFDDTSAELAHRFKIRVELQRCFEIGRLEMRRHRVRRSLLRGTLEDRSFLASACALDVTPETSAGRRRGKRATRHAEWRR
jgi:hypothetical protein